MRRCTILTTLAEAEALGDAWSDLADACSAGPFARPLFALTWWRHLGQGSLLVVAVHEGDQLIALAPLHQRRVGPVSVVRWLGHGLGTVAEALVRPGHDTAGDLLWRTAGARGRVLDLLECRDVGPLPGQRSEAPRHPVLLQERDVCPVIDVHGDAEAHLADPACKRVRRTVRVARRRLAEAGHTCCPTYGGSSTSPRPTAHVSTSSTASGGPSRPPSCATALPPARSWCWSPTSTTSPRPSTWCC